MPQGKLDYSLLSKEVATAQEALNYRLLSKEAIAPQKNQIIVCYLRK